MNTNDISVPGIYWAMKPHLDSAKFRENNTEARANVNKMWPGFKAEPSDRLMVAPSKERPCIILKLDDQEVECIYGYSDPKAIEEGQFEKLPFQITNGTFTYFNTKRRRVPAEFVTRRTPYNDFHRHLLPIWINKYIIGCKN